MVGFTYDALPCDGFACRSPATISRGELHHIVATLGEYSGGTFAAVATTTIEGDRSILGEFCQCLLLEVCIEHVDIEVCSDYMPLGILLGGAYIEYHIGTIANRSLELLDIDRAKGVVRLTKQIQKRTTHHKCNR